VQSLPIFRENASQIWLIASISADIRNGLGP
jgi:hypothetical protein